jgi:glycerol-3-phosphate dehydrogenase (NAD(P)+)
MAAGEIVVIGTGQMAAMCARLLCDNGRPVVLVGRRDAVQHIEKVGESPQLPGVRLPERCSATIHPAAGDATVVAVPTQVLDYVLNDFSGILTNGPIVSCAKGVDLSSGRRPSETMRHWFPKRPVAVLSGPNIAGEVVDGKPTGAVVAAKDEATRDYVRDLFATDAFRVYTSDDVVGVELAGATKNVIALAAGIVDGLGLGDNAKAALLTRGLAEIRRLGEALGARPDTFSGLAGVGDLVTTCFSPDGRNRRVGESIGLGKTLEQATAALGSVCEGVPTAKAILQLAQKHGVELPICRAVAAVLFDGLDPRDGLIALMRRDPKAEV